MKNFYSRGGWRKQLIDQSAHFAWGAMGGVLMGFAGVAPLWAGLIVMALMLPREFWDQWPVNSWADTLGDFAAFAVGGYVGAIVW